jgi:hypothetical protein
VQSVSFDLWRGGVPQVLFGARRALSGIEWPQETVKE